MLLFVNISIINLNKTFSFALSYYFSEIVKLYNFFFWYLRKEVWVNSILEPTVFIGDQVIGLIKVVDVLYLVLKSKL